MKQSQQIFYLDYQSFALDALSYAGFGKFCANIRM